MRTVIGTWAWGDSRVWSFGTKYSEDDILAMAPILAADDDLFFDTAPSYGRGASEQLIAKMLRHTNVRGSVITKVQPYPWMAVPSLLCRAVEVSSQRLGVATIDEVVVHNPAPFSLLKAVLTSFGHLQKQGVINHIGLSNFDIGLMKRVIQWASNQGLHINSLQRGLNLASQSALTDGTLALCHSNGIELVAHGALGQGLFGGHVEFLDLPSRSSRHITGALIEQTMYLRSAVNEVAAARGVGPAAVALAWVRAKGANPILGMYRTGHLPDSYGSRHLALDPAETLFLDRVSEPWRRETS